MRIRTTGAWLAGLALISGAAQAQGPYVGAKLGLMDVDQGRFDNAQNIGVVLGYDLFSDPVMSGGVELELTTTLVEGDVNVGTTIDWDIDTQALYGVVRFGDQWYAKLKLGLLREKVSFSPGGSDSETGLSAGFGGGWRLAPNIALEAEYTRIEEDVAFWSIGGRYAF